MTQLCFAWFYLKTMTTTSETLFMNAVIALSAFPSVRCRGPSSTNTITVAAVKGLFRHLQKVVKPDTTTDKPSFVTIKFSLGLILEMLLLIAPHFTFDRREVVLIYYFKYNYLLIPGLNNVVLLFITHVQIYNPLLYPPSALFGCSPALGVHIGQKSITWAKPMSHLQGNPHDFMTNQKSNYKHSP